MNKLTTLLLCLSMGVIGFGQSNLVSIESYRNFTFSGPSSAGDFNSEFLQLNAGSDHAGTKLSLGLNYTRKFANDWYARVRPGFSVDNRTDESELIISKESGFERYREASNLEKKSSSVNLFVGGGKDIRLSDRFSVLVGLDLGLIRDRKSYIDYSLNLEYQYEGSSAYTTFDLNYERDFARFTRLGILPVIAPTLRINDHFSVSVELQYLASISLTNSEENYLYSDVQQQYDPTLVSEYSNETSFTFTSKASVVSISKVSPLLRFSYQF